MKNIQKAQSNLVNDTCTDCGSYADIGAVIDEYDTQLVIERVGDDAKEQAQQLIDLACKRFGDLQCLVSETEEGASLTITFNYSAEKMIFQLENNL